ncbi:MAG TPA: MYXO-CTERM sorting domain-containing protein [Polyangiaceae bacterium]|jgi:hypothetical protein|nr:MYXO-CTERM sorting domain-containing protein [Polyangiaceae bacterium]
MRRGAIVGAAIFTLAPAALAAPTWTNNRTTPYLGEIFSIDATGEPNWLWGAEDVLGDGLATFTTAEQALDLRTAYASTNTTQLWTRVYVSNAAAADTTLSVFVFVDADRNTATGGGTNATALDPAFTSENSPGGYEFAFATKGSGAIANVWQWQTTPTPGYVVVNVTPAQAAGEVGTDVDPIRVGAASHGYVETTIDLSVVGITATCDANLYVRSARATGASDLDMKYSTSCVPAKTNGVPTIVITPGCTTDAQCPQDGVCDNGTCVIAAPCVAAADCVSTDTCTPDGRCVPATGACTQGGTDCAAGSRCAPNGTCVPGGPSGTGEVEGGALHCSIGPAPRSALGFAFVAALIAVLFARRKKVE